MRTRILAAFLCGLALSTTGCVSMLIANSGRNIDRYENRSEVHRALGKPSASGLEGAERFEDYRFRGKIADRNEAQGLGMAAGLTLGLSEVVFAPAMLVALPFELFEQHEVRYYFDEAGKVTRLEKKSTPD